MAVCNRVVGRGWVRVLCGEDAVLRELRLAWIKRDLSEGLILV